MRAWRRLSAKRPDVAEGQPGAGQCGEDGEQREGAGHRVAGREVAEEQQRERGERAQARDEQRAPPVRARGDPARGALGGRQAAADERQAPAQVQRTADGVGAVAQLVGVEGVGHDEERQRGADPPPARPGTAADEHESAGDEAEQQQVSDRVEHRDGGAERTAVQRLQLRADAGGRGDRGGGAGGDRDVQPHAGRERADPAPQEQQERDEGQRVEAEEGGVGPRRPRDDVEVPVVELVGGRTAQVAEHGGGQAPPGGAVGPGAGTAHDEHADQAGEEEDLALGGQQVGDDGHAQRRGGQRDDPDPDQAHRQQADDAQGSFVIPRLAGEVLQDHRSLPPHAPPSARGPEVWSTRAGPTRPRPPTGGRPPSSGLPCAPW
ncbi:hypothetical protein JKP76_01080 [Blastococcus sp. TML/C7B]|uniref:hypothetical protein n=1 Tax=Blastococcus sp. TML/C7B TaxID=2798728 RepID=UPI00190DD6B5|nr:hypothetical protein [Blastococcus sp. TML/C7B]MBN1094777.1 hypothetical protein [Blastococcus sp. TML/C7B]